MLIFIAVGIYEASRLSIDALPDVTNNQVMVITSCPNLATQEVEQFITVPVETQFKSVPGVVELRSISRSGLSIITVVFKDKVPVNIARQQISERLKMAEEFLSKDFGSPEMVPPTTGLGEIYQYTIHPQKGYEHKYSPMDLRVIQDWIIRRQLLGVPGIVDVSTIGGFLKQYEVAVSPDKLVSMNISLLDVFAALSKNNQNTGGSYVEKEKNIYFIRGEGLIANIPDIENIVVKNIAGMPVRVRDIATVQFGHAPRFGAMTRNGQGETVGGVVLMLKGENSAKVISDVKEKMEEIKKHLPEGVEIDTFLDRSELIGRTINTVAKNLMEGALIVVFILALFLGNYRAGLIVASVIPLSMLFAITMMNIFGVTANLMSMGALDFGLIVDGAVIVVESILHIFADKYNDCRLTQRQMDDEVVSSSSKIMNSAVFGQIIILIVYIPIFALSGIEGKMFMPMAQTVSFAIIGALLLSLTYVPLMSSVFLSKNIKHKITLSDKFISQLQKYYTPLLKFFLKHRISAVAASVAILAGSFLLFRSLGGEFLPEMDEGDFQTNFAMRQGTNLTEMINTANKLEKILLDSFPEIKQVVAKIGTSEVPTDPMPVHYADLNIILEKDKSKWTSAKSKEDLAEKMNEVLNVIPGKSLVFEQPIQMRINELIAGVRSDIAIKVFGDNLDILAQKGKEVSKLIAAVPGTANIKVEQTVGMPQLVVKYNRDRIAQYGLNIEDCNAVLNTALAGGKAGVIYEGEKRFDLMVRFANYRDADEDKVKNIYVALPNGSQIPFSQIADISFQSAPTQISRENTNRRIVVECNVKGRDIESVVADIQKTIDDNLRVPAGYFVTYGGTFENLEEAKARLSIAVPAALVMIFMLLFVSFRSIIESLIIYSAIPLAAVGGVIALWIRGMNFSISAGIGFIALFGVAVLNGIVLIAYFNRLEKDGIYDIVERIMQGTAARLRPVLATAAVASLGFLPMALSTSAGSEVQKPLATVVIGGLVSSTILTLVVLPVLYSLFIGKRTNVKHAALSVAIAFAVCSYSASAQTPKRYSVDEAVALAKKNNLQLQSQRLNVQSSQSLQKSYFELPKIDVSFQYGQFSSINNDNSFSVQQTMPFPTFFHAQNNLYKAQTASAEFMREATENDVKTQVKSLCYRILHLRQSQNDLLYLDSLYADFSKAAALRFASGETYLLEKITAEAKEGEIRVQLKQNQTDMSASYTSLQALLNTADSIEIYADNYLEPLELSLGADSNNLTQNPALQYYYQQAAIADQSKEVEIASTLPDIRFVYTNQSIIGAQLVNGKDVFFDGGKRFSSFSIGVLLPLTFVSNAHKISSLDVMRQSLQLAADNQKQALQSQIQNAIAEYNQNKTQYLYYKNTAVPNAKLMIKSASESFRHGDIDYVEYTQALQNATSIKLNYLQSLSQINQSVININYLLNR